ncbi:reverse transcriptase domain-containing protein [Tanacetum coccineum]
MTTPVEKRNASKFCEFHREVGHTTNECMHLKKQIEEMLKAGKLSHLIKELKKAADRNLAIQEEVRKLVEAGIMKEVHYHDWLSNPVMIRDEEHSTSAWMNFVVVRSPSPYNGIIGRPGVRKLQAVPSTAHRMLKLPVEGGIITLKSSRLVPLEPKGTPSATNPMVEERVKVAINPEYPEQTIMIGSTLTEEGRNKLCGLLQRNLDIFTWKPADMTGVPRHIAEHRLNVREGCSPVRKKKRGQAAERNQAIHEEVGKLVEARIMKEVHYHDWLSNPVMVKKHDESWRMCVDFKDLNKACPKDGYSLLEIDWKVESLCGFPFKCFLKGYKGYHQIQMAKDDEEKIAFITSQGIFCYTKMPFGLRNVGATYQRLVDKAFHKQMSINLKVYVDYLVIKSRTEDEIVMDIEETFKTLREINMKLNTRKCTFGAEEGMFLGYKVNTKGLKKSDFYWTTKGGEAFKQMKQLIAELPMLTTPMEKEELIVYLAAAKETVSTVLMTEREAKQMPIYFVSRALRGPELNYTSMEKPRVSVKGQILADFIVERPEEESPDTLMEVKEKLLEPWILFTAVNPLEYEALIAGLSIAEQMGVKNLQANVDSRLVANQTNGLVERANRSLGEGIKARLDARSKNWMEELPHVLWAHRTMIKSSNGDTPFSLTYGTEAVIPEKIGMPTLRTAEVDLGQNNEALEINLDLLEERRGEAAIREAKSKEKMEKYYNSNIQNTSFKPGDLVYRNNDASRAEDIGKLGPKWEGPYEVTEALGKGAYKLRDHDGKQLTQNWNISNLKKCYVHKM